MLLGGCCEDEIRAPFELKDTLPLTLKSLTLYGHEGLALNTTLGRQLQDTIEDEHVLPNLKYVALEVRPKTIDDLWRKGRDFVEPPHDRVEQACRERGIVYETKRKSKCTKGGRGC